MGISGYGAGLAFFVELGFLVALGALLIIIAIARRPRPTPLRTSLIALLPGLLGIAVGAWAATSPLQPRDSAFSFLSVFFVADVVLVVGAIAGLRNRTIEWLSAVASTAAVAGWILGNAVRGAISAG
jgi:heme A synthase